MGYISFGYEGNEVHYSEAEFKRDLKRYLYTLNEDLSPCKFYEDCNRCMFSKYELCGKHYVNSRPIKYSFEIIKKVYKWAQEHPFKANNEVISETMGVDLSLMNNDEIRKWLDQEYKEPGKDK